MVNTRFDEVIKCTNALKQLAHMKHEKKQMKGSILIQGLFKANFLVF